jgi:hypothetical protein
VAARHVSAAFERPEIIEPPDRGLRQNQLIGEFGDYPLLHIRRYRRGGTRGRKRKKRQGSEREET